MHNLHNQSETVTHRLEEREMLGNDVSVVLAHGAWADGSSWSVIVALQEKGITAIAAPLALTDA
jgi:hypothetical protein